MDTPKDLLDEATADPADARKRQEGEAGTGETLGTAAGGIAGAMLGTVGGPPGIFVGAVLGASAGAKAAQELERASSARHGGPVDASATTGGKPGPPALASGKKKRVRKVKTAAEQEVARHRREREGEGSVVGALAGCTIGTVAGPPGAVAGAFLGAAAGAAVGALLPPSAADRQALEDEADARKVRGS